MAILINATNIKVGGGVQVAVSVINELFSDNRGKEIVYAVSTPVYEQLKVDSDKLKKVFVVDVAISKPLAYISSLKKLENIALDNKVKCVFSIFGPSYWTPKSAKHLIGFANAWLVSGVNERAYDAYPRSKRFFMRLKNYLLGVMLYNDASYYVTETNDVKDKFCNHFGCSPERIDVVGNTISQLFFDSSSDVFGLSKIEAFKFVTITHNYPHKNLKCIVPLGEFLNNLGFKCIFVVTIPESEYEQLDSRFKDYTHNIGPIKITECKSVYDNCDALFLPTLIECFTASYLEAMATKLPILTSGLPFAENICESSAYYFDPYCDESIKNVVVNFLRKYNSEDPEIKEKLNCYPELLAKYKSNQVRVNNYMALLSKLENGD